MNTVMYFALLGAAIGIVAAAIWMVVTLFLRRLHPLRIVVLAVSTASALGLVSVAGLLPPVLWWLPWLVALAGVAGVVVSTLRVLRSDPPTEPTRAQTRRLRRPSTISMIVEVIFLAAVITLAAVMG